MPYVGLQFIPVSNTLDLRVTLFQGEKPVATVDAEGASFINAHVDSIQIGLIDPPTIYRMVGQDNVTISQGNVAYIRRSTRPGTLVLNYAVPDQKKAGSVTFRS